MRAVCANYYLRPDFPAVVAGKLQYAFLKAGAGRGKDTCSGASRPCGEVAIESPPVQDPAGYGKLLVLSRG
jgi:hypothetical protein